MQYKKQLQQYQISEKDLTPKLRSMILEFEEAVKDYRELNNDIKNQNWEDEDEKDEMEKASQEMYADLKEMDEEICEKIEAYVKSKSQRQNKTQVAKPETASAGVETKANTNLESVTEKPEEKKKSGSILPWLIGGAAVILTFGVFNPFGSDE